MVRRGGVGAAGDEPLHLLRAPAVSPARLHKLFRRGGLDGVVRSRGLIWVASHPEDAIKWNQVGKSMTMMPGPAWLDATLPVEEWPADAI